MKFPIRVQSLHPNCDCRFCFDSMWQLDNWDGKCECEEEE